MFKSLDYAFVPISWTLCEIRINGFNEMIPNVLGQK